MLESKITATHVLVSNERLVLSGDIIIDHFNPLKRDKKFA